MDLQVLYDDLRIREVIPATPDCINEEEGSCAPTTKLTGLYANVKPCVPGLSLQDSEEIRCANLTNIAGRIKDNSDYSGQSNSGIDLQSPGVLNRCFYL